jgi:hypothetical protein
MTPTSRRKAQRIFDYTLPPKLTLGDLRIIIAETGFLDSDSSVCFTPPYIIRCNEDFHIVITEDKELEA